MVKKQVRQRELVALLTSFDRYRIQLSSFEVVLEPDPKVPETLISGRF